MANLTESAVWETGVYMLEKTDPVVGGPDGIDNKPLKQLANRTLYLKGQVDSLGNLKVNISVIITAGNGLTGGGNLAASRTISLGTPSSVTSSSSNSVTGTSHTHALDDTGVVAGTYRSVTVDAKGRVTDGDPVQIGLITATSPTRTANEVTGNSNTYLNVYERVGTKSTSVGTSTKVTGSGSVTVSSNANGDLIIYGSQNITGNAATASKWQTARTISFTGDVTGSASVDGSANVTIQMTAANKADRVHTHQISDVVGLQNALGSKADLANPTFLGIPKAPTAAAGTNTTQIATTEFVSTAIANLVGSAPEALNTLSELANALGGDANLRQTLLSEIGKRALKSTTLSGYGITDFVIREIRTEDLNAVTTPGFYKQNTSSNATTARNYPDVVAGTLVVYPSTGNAVQQQYSTYNNQYVYMRNLYGGSWSTWKRIDAQNKLDADATAVAASKLATARTITLTGAVSGSTTFDGSGNVSINTNDNLTIGLVTSTSATGTTNVATNNSNTYINAVEKRGSSSNSVGSSTKVTGRNGVLISSDTSGVLYADGLLASSIPTSKTHDAVFVTSMKRMFMWGAIGGFNGYSSAELGHGIFSSSSTPLPGTVLADGRTLQKSQYPALFEYAKLQGLVKTASQWVVGSFWFVDLGGDNFRIPDVRGQFVRAVGADPDNANVMMVLGAYRQDKMQRITGEFWDLSMQDSFTQYPAATGAFYTPKNDGTSRTAPKESISLGSTGDLIRFDSSRVTRTGAETEPKNTALHYYIYVY